MHGVKSSYFDIIEKKKKNIDMFILTTDLKMLFLSITT